jgi:hypothetical protein
MRATLVDLQPAAPNALRSRSAAKLKGRRDVGVAVENEGGYRNGREVIAQIGLAEGADELDARAHRGLLCEPNAPAGQLA